MTATTAPTLVRKNYGRGHGYLLNGEKVPGVTTVLNVLDKPALKKWFADQAAERAVNEWDRLSELPVAERLRYIAQGPRDRVQAAALRGNQIHDLGQQLAEGKSPDVPPEHLGPVQAYARWLDEWEIEPLGAETPLASTQFKYGGTSDLWGTVGKRGGERALLDIKTGKGIYSEVAWQLAAYRYADVMLLDGTEVPVPEVDAVYVAHVLPDTVRMLPIEADRYVFREFAYLLEAYKATQRATEWPRVGEAIQP